MNKFRYALSVLLAPAVIFANTTGSGCTGGGSTPPAFNLPARVLGVQSVPSGTATTTYDLTLSGVAAGFDLTNTTYHVWCTNPSNPLPRDVVDPSTGDLFDKSGAWNYTVYNSYGAYPANLPSGNTGTDTTAAALQGDWNAVNWVLNFPKGAGNDVPGATVSDEQAVIWQLLHSTDGIPYLALYGGPNALPLYNEALTHKTFIPATGQLAALILVPDNPPASLKINNPNFQGVLLPITVKGASCTGTSSAVLNRTVSTTSANAFQAITYGWSVKNTGTTTLTDIVITDDNGTPGYSNDDYTVGTIASLAPGATSATITKTVYLPIRLFYQNGAASIWDTLIPTADATSLSLTYLNDNDVTDNTYGTGASAGWKAVGGHTFSQILPNTAEFGFYDAKGNLVSDFTADYLVANSSFPSKYGAGLHGAPKYGGTKYINSIGSTLSGNLNGFAKFYGATVNSPVGDADWNAVAGYKVVVDKGIFGMVGMGYAAVLKNNLNATKSVYSCAKYTKGVSYTPAVVRTYIVDTAYLTANVLGCCTIVKAKASICETLNGGSYLCPGSGDHECQHQEECRCTCGSCLGGKHEGCSQSGCKDTRCQDKNCAQQCNCHCAQCSGSHHDKCDKVGCNDGKCQAAGCVHRAAYSYYDYKCWCWKYVPAC